MPKETEMNKTPRVSLPIERRVILVFALSALAGIVLAQGEANDISL